jgi:hypothetical protein
MNCAFYIRQTASSGIFTSTKRALVYIIKEFNLSLDITRLCKMRNHKESIKITTNVGPNLSTSLEVKEETNSFEYLFEFTNIDENILAELVKIMLKENPRFKILTDDELKKLKFQIDELTLNLEGKNKTSKI